MYNSQTIRPMNEYNIELPASTKVHELDRSDRPREKAIANGITTLSNAELLAIILGSGTEGLSVIDLAKSMLARNNNSLTKLARTSIPELTSRYKGIGPAKAVTLLAALQLGLRCSNESVEPDPQIRSSADVLRYMQSQIGLIEHEEFWILLTSQANRVKHRIMISRGGLTSTIVDIRLIMRHALTNACPGIILIHNHPSGNTTPSSHDDNLTRRISEAAKILELRVIDHVIIAGNEYYSYADNGRMPS